MYKSYKHVLWVGSSKKDLMAMADEVKSAFGFALYLVQQGKKKQNAKQLKEFSVRSAKPISLFNHFVLPPYENFIHTINLSF
jgi:phage-related protein